MYIRPSSKVVPQNEWRWNRVIDLLGTPGAYPVPPKDDKYVCRMFRFMKSFNACDGNPDREKQLAEKQPILYEALTLRLMGSKTVKSTIEASLIAKVPKSYLAEQYDMSEDIIDWYEKLWFDIGEKPLSRLQVITQMAPNALNSTIDPNDLDTYLRVLGGSYSQDIFLDTVEIRPLDDDELKQHKRVAKSLLAYKGNKAIFSYPINSYTVQGLSEMYVTSMDKAEDREVSAGKSGTAFTEIINKALEGSKWSIMGEIENKNSIPQDLHAIELEHTFSEESK